MCGSVSLPNQPADDAVLWTTGVHKSGVGIGGDEERRKGKISIYWILNFIFWVFIIYPFFFLKAYWQLLLSSGTDPSPPRSAVGPANMP